MSGGAGYSEGRTASERGVSWQEGQALVAEADRKRRAHQARCTGCEACDLAAEARKAARDE